MNFNELFKIPTATPEYIKIVESLIINHQTEDKKNVIDPADFNNDSDREEIVCRNLCLLKENYSHQQPFYFKDLNLDRELSPSKIYQFIEDNFIFSEEVPELKQAFKTKNLDLFFKLWLTNQYSLKLPNFVIYLKNDWSREYFGVRDNSLLKKYQSITKDKDLQDILKIIENTPRKIVSEDLPKKDLIPSLDIMREFYLVESLVSFHRNKDEMIIPKMWMFHYFPQRELSLKEIRKKIELLFEIDDSAFRLKKAFRQKKMKYFFLYFVKNNYLMEAIPANSLMTKRWRIKLDQNHEESL